MQWNAATSAPRRNAARLSKTAPLLKSSSTAETTQLNHWPKAKFSVCKPTQSAPWVDFPFVWDTAGISLFKKFENCSLNHPLTLTFSLPQRDRKKRLQLVTKNHSGLLDTSEVHLLFYYFCFQTQRALGSLFVAECSSGYDDQNWVSTQFFLQQFFQVDDLGGNLRLGVWPGFPNSEPDIFDLPELFLWVSD